MKRTLIVLLSASLTAGALAADTSLLKNEKDRLSYALGMNTGRSMTNYGIEISPEPFTAGLRAVVFGEPSLLRGEEITNIMNTLNAELQAKYQERQKKARTEMAEKNRTLAEQNQKEAEAFLAANKQKEGIKVLPVKLPGGQTAELQYKVFTMGTGPKPTTNDAVVVNYRGSLLGGAEFDSSYKRGEPATNEVSRVIKGWSEALCQMPVGSKWQLFIPAELGYGTNGTRGIPPGAMLQFDVELLGVQPKAKK
jgi:FKBP-type peptidyl-prolyl cis-trans isomerase FklB